MKVLLDTHVWIWWLLGSERLSLPERRSLDQVAAAGGCHLSAMSLWEAQMLHSKGRLSLDRPFAAWLRQAADPGVVAVLPIQQLLRRCRWPDNVRDDVLARLLALNAERYQEEVALGLHSKAGKQAAKAARASAAGAAAGKRRGRAAKASQGGETGANHSEQMGYGV